MHVVSTDPYFVLNDVSASLCVSETVEKKVHSKQVELLGQNVPENRPNRAKFASALD